jgi:hypothetical protein
VLMFCTKVVMSGCPEDQGLIKITGRVRENLAPGKASLISLYMHK